MRPGDDIAAIFESIRSTQANILERLERLEHGQDVSGSNELVVPGGWGYCSPTSPPSLRIQVRRAYMWMYDPGLFNSTLGVGWPDFYPDLPISAFTNAYYYRAVVPFVDVDYFPPYDGFDVEEVTPDFATYEEAAANFASDFFNWYVEPYNAGDPVVPLCAIIVRNDGTTGAVNRYLPITLNDRTQSSFLMRDLRPWFTPIRVS